MKCRDLENNIFEWKIKGSLLNQNLARQARSSYHLSARVLLQELFPTMQIYEEVPVQIIKGKTLFLDFYIPIQRIAMEVNGEQHFKFVEFFHKTRANFLKQLHKDQEKKDWCEQNNIKVINLNYSETIDEWRSKLTS